MNNLKVACSPLTGTIFAGVSSKPGQFTGKKVDVTNDCLGSSADSILITGKTVTIKNKGRWFRLDLIEVDENGEDIK